MDGEPGLATWVFDAVGLAMSQWGLLLVLAVVVLGMQGRIAKGAGLFHLFRDDDEIFGGQRLGGIESRFAGGSEPVAGWRGWVARLLASPAFWSGAGLAVLVGLIWLITFSAPPSGQLASALHLLPTEPAGAVAPVARWALLAVLLASVLASVSISRRHLSHPRSDFGTWSPRRRLAEPVRAGLGGVLGLLAVMAVQALAAVLLGATGTTGSLAGFVVVAVPFAALVVWVFTRRNALACVSIFSFAILLAIALAALARLGGPWAQLLLIAAVIWVIRANGRFAKYRLPGFESLYDDDRTEQPVGGRAGGHAAQVGPLQALQAWHARVTEGRPDHKPVLVVLATSGGAYRATFWTSLILDRLISDSHGGTARWAGLDGNIRLVTGASGGMVAGGYFVAMAADGALQQGITDRIIADTRDSLRDGCGRRQPIGRDSLSPVVHQMVRDDFWQSFRPAPPARDRGRVLDAQWRTLQRSFGSLRTAEAEGRAPSIVYSPMLVESGALALMSNLDLGALRRRSTRIHDRPGAELDASVEVLDQFPGTQDALTLATATRMNASFPYVSPAVSLPTRVDRRVVDAGYFDNYGIDIATGFLEEPQVCAWLRENCAGVAVIELRAFEGQPLAPPATAVARAFQFLTSPPEALFSARRASQVFRNNQQLRAAADRLGRADGAAGDFLRVFTFEAVSDVSMSWYLRLDEVEALDLLLRAPGPDEMSAARAALATFAMPDRFVAAVQGGDWVARRTRFVLQRHVIAREFAALQEFWVNPAAADPRAGEALPTWLAAAQAERAARSATA